MIEISRRGLCSVSSVWSSVSTTTDGSQQQLIDAFGVLASTRGERIGMQPESAAVFGGHRGRRKELGERLAEVASSAAHPDNYSQNAPVRPERDHPGAAICRARARAVISSDVICICRGRCARPGRGRSRVGRRQDGVLDFTVGEKEVDGLDRQTATHLSALRFACKGQFPATENR
jgi:hypothetical protein